MQFIYLILYLAAAVCFAMFTLNIAHRRVNYLGLGVLCWALVPLLQTLQKL